MSTQRPPADVDIRPVLRRSLLASTAGEDSVVVEELGLCRGRVRVDLAVVNGSLHGYEIKSDRDSLDRLAGQADVYSKVLDQVTLVVGERHLAHAMNRIPAWWGITRVDDTSAGPELHLVRAEGENPARDPRALVELLWLPEALAILEARGQARGMRGKPRRLVWDRLCESLDTEEISSAVRAHLKARARTSDPQVSA